MSTPEVAAAFTAMCKQGQFAEAGEQYWSDDVVSIEAEGDPAAIHGKDAVRDKGEWWEAAHEVHSAEAHGPYVNGDEFAVRFVMDVTVKETGQRITMDEVALYTVEDDKIVEERFLY